ncbi:phosphodiester glycosidase family protein [Flexivirga sp. ID2601S]|uniref:Phosphodiester glycosidase family protein n=1 Tax=Flexivirga aerilata TaxID=1656889 RepID=A0A849ANX1_9MICO|nr:phosphodiester glycosidase family protein [Flexivirga aerilata]NNG40030.1 phosphodiester glycosidase family protein [Flexivirga aerilata]
MTRRRLYAATVVTALGLAIAVPTSHAASEHLPLGAANLSETRTTTTLAAGITRTRIVRGTTPASPDEINTTDQGPWVVNEVLIDPAKAKGRLEATYGPDLARAETVSDLVGFAGGLVGTNASFFTFTASKDYPGDPVGLGLYGGKLLSEPTTDPAEQDVVFDGQTGRMLFGRTQWSGRAVNTRTGGVLDLDAVDHPPAATGETDWITTEFGAQTPSGPGAEVVLDKRGCTVRTNWTTRGTALAPGQTAVQATGADATTLQTVAGATSCLSFSQSLTDAFGKRIALTRKTFGVNGRYRLTADGEVVAPPGTGSFFARNPRTIFGHTADGKIALVTIDGRMASSVGTTIDESAAVATSLGLVDAVNLDGGGSTTLATASGPLNTPSGAGNAQRLVGDALVWVR